MNWNAYSGRGTPSMVNIYRHRTDCACASVYGVCVAPFGDLKRTKRLIHDLDIARFDTTSHLFPTQDRRPNYKKMGARFSSILDSWELESWTE